MSRRGKPVDPASERATVVLLITLAAAGPVSAGVIATVPSCAGPGSETSTVTGVEARLELRLADGRLLRLAGVDPAEGTPEQPDRAELARARFAERVAGQPVRFDLLDGKPDRWGRLPALAYLPGGVSLARVALDAGLGRYLAEPAAQSCRDQLLAAEIAARAARLGLWEDGYYAVLAPGDAPSFAERSGTTVIAQGRLTDVAAGPYRTELRFAARDRSGRDTLSVSIPPRAVKSFKDQGVDLSSVIGRTVRVRGLLDLRFGPRIDVGTPDALEVLPAADTPGPG